MFSSQENALPDASVSRQPDSASRFVVIYDGNGGGYWIAQVGVRHITQYERERFVCFDYNVIGYEDAESLGRLTHCKSKCPRLRGVVAGI